AGYQAIAFEGQIVDGVHYKAMAGIKVGRPPAAEDIVAVLNQDAIVVARSFVNGMRPGIGRVKLQTLRHTLVGRDPERVIARVGAANTLGERVGQSNAGQDWAAGGSLEKWLAAEREISQDRGLVDVALNFKMCPFGSHIPGHESH